MAHPWKVQQVGLHIYKIENGNGECIKETTTRPLNRRDNNSTIEQTTAEGH